VDELHELVGKRIRELAQARRITLSHLPDLSGTSVPMFWDVLKGRKSPTLRSRARSLQHST